MQWSQWNLYTRMILLRASEIEPVVRWIFIVEFSQYGTDNIGSCRAFFFIKFGKSSEIEKILIEIENSIWLIRSCHTNRSKIFYLNPFIHWPHCFLSNKIVHYVLLWKLSLCEHTPEILLTIQWNESNTLKYFTNKTKIIRWFWFVQTRLIHRPLYY